uniref:Phytochrome n=1 Tax=Amphora coffeiformis TaxID=265554 RepID=A0A7S3L7N0_9STRA|mmetsp:Transcript_3557/g.6790  ORF Transcript_3557/g.6790 Transcript_3557/m.6790 type:complete len:833 (+) Transcript_3557:114-2612(+)
MTMPPDEETSGDGDETGHRPPNNNGVKEISFQTSSGERIPKTSAPSVITDEELFECDHIPLHLIGHIQGNTGHVIFVTFPLGQVVAVDENIRDLEWITAPPGAPSGARAMLGTPLNAWVPKNMQQAIMRAMYHSTRNGLVRNFYFEQGYALSVVVASAEKNLFALEIEAAEGEDILDKYNDTLMYISKLVDFYANESIVNMACDTIFELFPEYDRGMVYRFNDDLSGEVIHEVRRGNLKTTYLGHRFPKYDLPLSARQLYLKNGLRYIRSSAEPNVPIVSMGSQQVDLTHVRSRSVARPHLIYMQNMGVRCSMSLAIVVENELWGLFAFHGYKRPFRPSLHQRIACEAIASMVSVRVESLIRKAASARIVSLGESLQRWNTTKSFQNNLKALGQEILDVVEADVLVGSMNGESVVIGDATIAPSEAFWRNPPKISTQSDLVVAISREEIAAKGYSEQDCPASGFVYFGDGEMVQIYLGRSDRSTDVKWAGNPDQPKLRGLDGVLNPRNSFQIFMEKARKESKAWSTADLNVISVLQDRIRTGQAHEWMTALLKSDIEEANMRYFSLLDRDRDNSQFFAHVSALMKRFGSESHDRMSPCNIGLGIDNRFQGTGLGLFICVSLCHQLGGYIACLSTPNIGTTFHVGIPVEILHGRDTTSDFENNRDEGTIDASIPLRSSILIVDDNKVNLKLLKMSLKKELRNAEKYVDVVMADGGEAAFAKYKEILPSVVIIDYHMPGMNGLDATKAIRKYEQAHGIQPSFILSYTADLSCEAHDLLVTSGSDGIMTKPPPRDFIQKLVRRMEVSKTTQVMQNYTDCATSGSLEEIESSHASS